MAKIKPGSTVGSKLVAKHTGSYRPTDAFASDYVLVAATNGAATGVDLEIKTWLLCPASDGYVYGDIKKTGGVSASDSLAFSKLDPTNDQIDTAAETRWEEIILPNMISQPWFQTLIDSGHIIEFGSNTSALQIPVGDTSTRPTAPVVLYNSLRYNTSDENFEYYVSLQGWVGRFRPFRFESINIGSNRITTAELLKIKLINEVLL